MANDKFGARKGQDEPEASVTRKRESAKWRMGPCHKDTGPSLNGHPLTNSGTAGALERSKKVKHYKPYSDAQKKRAGKEILQKNLSPSPFCNH